MALPAARGTVRSTMHDVFRDSLNNIWKQAPTECEHLEFCGCKHPFYRTIQLQRWMTTTEPNELKTNIERLLEEEPPHKMSGMKFCDPKSVLKGDKRSILVYSILLSLEQGRLIYIFQSTGIIDEKLTTPNYNQAQLENTLKRNKISEAEAFMKAFEDKKWAFFPVHLSFRMDRTVEEKFKLPFCSRKRVNEKGGTASVLGVLVHEDFISKDEDLETSFGEPLDRPEYGGKCYELAVKVYSNAQYRPYEREVEAFKGLSNQPGMVKYFGCYSHNHGHGKQTHNILLELGKMDLSEYFRKLHPPKQRSEIAWFWQSLYKIAEAIQSIHEFSYLKNVYNGVHYDVKPDNILLVGDEFKLADFGFSGFREKENSNGNLLEMRKRHGTDSYGAPELSELTPAVIDHENHPLILQKIDIWSFGCVLSVAATWLVLGSKGIDEYVTLRQLASKKRNRGRTTDVFHDDYNVLSEIRHWHSYLKHSMRVSDDFTSEILDLVDSYLLKGNAADRLTSNELCEKLKSIVFGTKNGDSYEPDECVLEALCEAGKANQLTSTSFREKSLGPHLAKKIAGDYRRPRDAVSKNIISPTQDSVSTLADRDKSGAIAQPRDQPPPQRAQASPPTPKTKEEDIWRVIGENTENSKTLCEIIMSEHPRVANIKDSSGCTPLMRATEAFNSPIILLLIENLNIYKGDADGGLSICNRDAEGKTVLHYAGMRFSKETEEYLRVVEAIVIGAQQQAAKDFVNILDNDGRSALWFCVLSKKLHTAEMLIRHGALVNFPAGSKGKNVFKKAVSTNNVDMVELFQNKGATWDWSEFKDSADISKEMKRMLKPKRSR